mgnify:CR=1 FL=1
MQTANPATAATTNAPKEQQAQPSAQAEEQKSFSERMATMERPNRDTRVKTEDVTATSGMTFRDFNLADSVQFVSHLHSVPLNPYLRLLGHL